MGRAQSISPPPCSASRRRLPLRVCLRKGCGRIYQPRRWNQRYCQDPECLKLVRRWQNAQRQQQRRQRAEVREQQAAAERQRRQRRRQAQATPRAPPAPDPPPDGGAWSRRRKNSAPFCQRPGCYEPLPAGTRARLGTAVRAAVASCSVSWIESASGCGARPPRAGTDAVWSIRPGAARRAGPPRSAPQRWQRPP